MPIQAKITAIHYRVRMKYNKWYVFLYDKNHTMLDDAYGPYASHGEAVTVGENTKLEDMDKSNIPFKI